MLLGIHKTRSKFKYFSDKVIKFRPREPVFARRMLRTHGGFCRDDEPMSTENEIAFRNLLGICAGLPLALGIAGASVRKIAERKEKNQKQNA